MIGQPFALGCMRLSTAADRDEERALATLRAAVAAGVTLFDTADAYCHDDRDVGHNERLVAEVLTDGIKVATKGGLTRPKGQWVPDGRAKHLEAAAEASAKRLGRPPDLYLLHALDPSVPFETSVRALDRILRRGLARAIGLCNVTADQLARARQITEISAVQAELSPFVDDPLRNGLLDAGLPLLAHRPLGGPDGARRLGRDADLVLLGPPQAIALAWLRTLSPLIIPLPGATRPDTVAPLQALSPDARAVLDARFASHTRLARTSRASRRPPDDAPGEVLVLMGIQGSGKSTRARDYAERGWLRLNRDEEGGRLGDLLPKLDQALADGTKRVVLDNTYAWRADRNRVAEVAWAHGVPVRCEQIRIPLADAQVNALRRMIRHHGGLPDLPVLRRREDPVLFGPGVQYTYERDAEPPSPDEGFVRIDVVDFVRASSGTRRGLLVELDTIRRSRHGARSPRDASDVELVPGAREALRRHAEQYVLLGIAWHPDTDGAAISAATRDLLDLPVDIAWCPHRAGPTACWCRKPLPGLGVAFMERHDLDPRHSMFVGSSAIDRRLAATLGFGFTEAASFLAGA